MTIKEEGPKSLSSPEVNKWRKVSSLLETGNASLILAALKKADETLDESLVQTLVRSLCFHSDPLVRDEATQWLGEYGEDEDLYRLLLLSRDPDWCVRCSAVSALSGWTEVDAVKRVEQMIRGDRNATVRKWAVKSLYDQNPEREKLDQIFLGVLEKERDPFVKLSIAAVLVMLGHEEYLKTMQDIVINFSSRSKIKKEVLYENYYLMTKDIDVTVHPIPGP